MPRPSLRLILGIGIPFLVLAVLVTAWAIDTSRGSGKVPRNVSVAGRDVSRMAEDELARTVDDVARSYEATPVEVRTGEKTYRIPAGQLGLRLDVDTTIDAALEIGDDTMVLARPFAWLGSLVSDRKAPLTFTVDDTALAAGLASLEKDANPSEPSLVPGPSGLAIVSGSPGRTVDPSGVREQLLRRARSGEKPIIVNAKLIAEDPVVSDADARALAERINTGTASGLEIVADDLKATIPAPTVRGWLGSEIADGAMQVTLDETAAMEAIVKALPEATKPKDATITLVNGAVQITPSREGRTCCAPDTAERVLAAIQAGEPRVEVDLEVAKPTFTTEDAEKLGIKEPVGSITEWNGQPQVKSFTTYHPCCANRVVNIQKMADTVRGTLVKPGEKFSINAVVGERTAAKGYVPAGAIANGKHVDEIGGGVSQFATTMFNAAYFAGLQIDTYQAHSEYFSRYPRGREATMGFPNPDLVWTNNSPYGILVWTSYTDTSITVTLYSTQWATAAQTGSKESRSGRCTVVTTERTVTYPDGTTSKGNFSARYRDEGATTC